jgi:tetratricopeptide (TPR) repeat protein
VKNILPRIVSLLLVACLSADPTLAAALSQQQSITGRVDPLRTFHFEEEALSEPVAEVLHDIEPKNNIFTRQKEAALARSPGNEEKLFIFDRFARLWRWIPTLAIVGGSGIDDSRSDKDNKNLENQSFNPQAILEEALRIIDRRWELGENYEVAALVKIGDMFEQDGLFQSASNCYEKSIAVATEGLSEYGGDVSRLRAYQARAQWKLGNKDQARELFDKALDDARARKETRTVLLAEMIDAGMVAEALAILKKPPFSVYEKKPELLPILINHLAIQGHFEEAIDLAEGLDSSVSNAQKAIVEARKGNLKESIDLAGKSSWNSYSVLSEVSRLRNEGKTEDALQLLEALPIGPDTRVKELLTVADLQIKARKFQQVRSLLKRVTNELEKDAAERIKHIDNAPQIYARAGAAMAATGDLDHARKLFAKAYEITPMRGDGDRSYDDMASIATAQADAGLYEDALHTINQATQHHPEELIEARIHLAIKLAAIEPDRAKELLEKGSKEASRLPEGEIIFGQLVLATIPIGIDIQKYLQAAMAEVQGPLDPYSIAPAVPIYLASNRLSELIVVLN